MKPYTLLVDMDSIVADLSAVWYPDINKLAGQDIVNHETVLDWDIAKTVPWVDKNAVYEIIKAPGYYQKLPLVPGGYEALHELYKLKQPDGTPWFYIRFLSAAHVSVYAPMDKLVWVNQHFPWIGTKGTITAYYKEDIRGDFLIDDAPRNIVNYKEAWPMAKVLTIDYPYNRLPEVDNRLALRAHGYQDTVRAWKKMLYWLVVEAQSRGMVPADQKRLEHRLKQLLREAFDFTS